MIRQPGWPHAQSRLASVKLSSISPWRLEYGLYVLIGIAAVAIGYIVSRRPDLSPLIAVALLLAAGLALSPGWWALAALVLALLGPGLIALDAQFQTLTVFPGITEQAHLLFAWGALGLALATGKADSPVARRIIVGLGLLAVAIGISYAFNPAEPLRPLFYLALLGEPFAVIAALLLRPPGPALRRTIIAAAVALLALQPPIAVLQAIVVGTGDPVTGTLAGTSDAPHIIGVLAIIGAIWLYTGIRRTPWRNVLIASLLPIPFLSDAKQAILALPATLIVRWRGQESRLQTAVMVSAVLLLFAVPAFAQYSTVVIEHTLAGGGGKPEAARDVWQEVTADLPSFAVGEGPAQTVSHLEPAKVARNYVHPYYFGGTFQSPRSSAIGLFGDLGLLGVLAYLALLASVFFALRNVISREAIAAATGVVLLAVLGVLGDWWEQGQFTLFVAVLAGLALTAPDVVANRVPMRPGAADGRS
jgi:hypothetical protein